MPPRSPRRPAPTYAASGVDLAGRARALPELIDAARYHAPPSHGTVVPAAGHFAGLVRLGRTTLALTTDTVGTKVLLAERLGRWEEVGEDAIAINVNDLAAVGARPAAVVDTILCGSADPAIFRAIGVGMRRGLAAARCSLVGGETALVAEIVRGLDLGATALGFFPGRRRPILGDRIRPGDRILGIPSSGLHANGLTLVRRLVDESGLPLDRARAGGRGTLGSELLRASRSYSHAVDGVADLAGVVGLAHVSGGGVRNLCRLSTTVRFTLDGWPRPPGLFRWLQTIGSVGDREMFGTFNMGVGFLLVVRPGAERAVRRALAARGASDVLAVGRVETGTGVELPSLGLVYRGYA
ncbi:MAG TPA: phosphoribosylformylglycinamidine cyclo-ligase [Thermoplasmata archaeon]|nr:phosphoribosylformylglycinamidine cyclo-ligase [Thermoplasmata archaeon]